MSTGLKLDLTRRRGGAGEDKDCPRNTLKNAKNKESAREKPILFFFRIFRVFRGKSFLSDLVSISES